MQWPQNVMVFCNFTTFPSSFPLSIVCLYTDVASKEQEKPIMPLEEKEEGDSEDAAMETEMQKNEDLRAVDTEELKPEKKKSTATKTPGTLT